MNQHLNEDLPRRLESLGRSVPASADLTQRVMSALENETPTSTHIQRITLLNKRWIVRGTIGLAACAILAVFIWTLFVSSPQRAYGIEDVRSQLANVKSLLVAGKGQNGAPFEVYVERPDRCYRVQSDHRMIHTATKNMMISDRDKTVVITPGDALDARFLVESLVQAELFSQLLGDPTKLHKVRTELVGEIKADVYERTEGEGAQGLRREVFLNPRTGLPVKTILYLKQGKSEQVIATIDRIEADGPSPKGAFDFEVPAGYQLKQVQAPAEQPPGAQAFSSAQGGSLRFDLSYTLNLDDKAVLICWSLYDAKNPREDMKLPSEGTLSLAGPKGKYTEHLLRADEMPDGHHWRWSLLVPTDPGVPIAENLPTMTVKAGSTLSFTSQPVKFPRAEMSQFVMEAQKRTLPANQKALTLEAIEQKLQEFAVKERSH